MRRWNATQGPLVTKVIVGINAVVYALTATGVGGRGIDGLESRLALFGPAIASGDTYRLVTNAFLHYGILHIAFNMVLLYRFGLMLEPALGRTRFLLLYTAATLTGSFGALLLSPNVFTGGASGAVFGLMGAIAIGYRQRGISLSEGGIGGLIVINLILSVAVPGISLGGHVGGLIGGAAVGGVMLSPRRRVDGVVVALAVIVLAVVGSLAIVH